MEPTSIAAIGKIEQLQSAGSVSPIGEMGVVPAQPVSADLQQQFSDLMSRHRSSSQDAGSHDAINAVTHVLESQQAGLNSTHQKILDVMDRSPDMSMGEAVMAGAEVAMMTATLKMRMDIAEGITQSSNKSLQSLLKNE